MFVSFSGGKDSTVTSSITTRALGTPSIIHLYGNTTLEFPETLKYVERFKAANRRTPLLTAQNIYCRLRNNDRSYSKVDTEASKTIDSKGFLFHFGNRFSTFFREISRFRQMTVQG